MYTEIGIFVNGMSGVFLGMGVLYLAMKMIALASVERSDPEAGKLNGHS